MASHCDITVRFVCTKGQHLATATYQVKVPPLIASDTRYFVQDALVTMVPDLNHHKTSEAPEGGFYLIQSGTSYTAGHCKTSLDHFLSVLQMGNPQPIKVITAIPRPVSVECIERFCNGTKWFELTEGELLDIKRSLWESDSPSVAASSTPQITTSQLLGEAPEEEESEEETEEEDEKAPRYIPLWREDVPSEIICQIENDKLVVEGIINKPFAMHAFMVAIELGKFETAWEISLFLTLATYKYSLSFDVSDQYAKLVATLPFPRLKVAIGPLSGLGLFGNLIIGIFSDPNFPTENYTDLSDLCLGLLRIDNERRNMIIMGVEMSLRCQQNGHLRLPLFHKTDFYLKTESGMYN